MVTGLCGRKNDDPTDDFYTDEYGVQILQSTQDFGNFYKYSDRFVHSEDYGGSDAHPCATLSLTDHATVISASSSMRSVFAQ